MSEAKKIQLEMGQTDLDERAAATRMHTHPRMVLRAYTTKGA